MRLTGLLMLFLLLFAFHGSSQAQVDSIRVVQPGTSLLLDPAEDTLWVLSNRQMNKALTLAEKGRLFDSLLRKHEALKAYQDSIIARKNQIIKRLDSAYNRYTQKWDTCNRKLEQTRIKLEKARQKQTKTGLLGAVGGVVLTGLLFLLL